MSRTTVLILILSAILGACSNRERMLASLEILERQNNSDSLLTNDSLALAIADYFDKHGTANEQLRAYYMLGRTYYDRNEKLKALEAFQEAASCADTTATDCDYHTLLRVHAQMAGLFCEQLLPYDMLEELEHYGKYALLDHDTLLNIDAYARRADAYDILGIEDSVISIRQQASQMFLEEGDTISAIMNVCTIIVPFVERNRLQDAAHILTAYESLPDLFDDSGAINSYHNIYYYIKGRYLLATSKQDSAELMFRKMQEVAETPNDKEAGFRGLYLLFEKKHIPDSMAKYADLCYAMNDSVYRDDAKVQIQKMHSLYNFEKERLAAITFASEARKSRFQLYIVLFSMILVIVVSYQIITTQRRRRKDEIDRLNAEYQSDLARMRTLQNELLAIQERQYTEVAKDKDLEIKKLRDKLNQHLDARLLINANSVDKVLHSCEVVVMIKKKLSGSKHICITDEEWTKLYDSINQYLPLFFEKVNENKSLSRIEYNICVLTRLGFQPKEQLVLLGLPLTYNISVMRKRLLYKIFDINGSAKDFARYIQSVS